MPTFPEGFTRPENVDGASVLNGQIIKVLFRQEAEDGGFSLVYSWFKPNFLLPRHSHNADCLYYVVTGTAHLGQQVLRAGDGFFVPADAPYQYSAGPEGVEVLEFRKTGSFDMKITDDTERYAKIFAVAAANAANWSSMTAPPQR